MEFNVSKRLRVSLVVLFFLFNLSSLRSETLTHTSVSDFNPGTYSGNGINVSEDGSLKLAYSASGTLPEYHTGTGLPLKNFGMAIWNRRIYVSGGITNNNSVQSEVYSAPINSDGSIGSWKSENALPSQRAHHTMSFLNGRLYVVGGSDISSGPQNTVYSASLDSKGEVGEWKIEPSLPEPRWRHAATVVGDHIYISGGHDGSTIPQNSIYSAQANANGSINSWKMEEKSLPNRLYYHSMVEINKHLYVIGGKDGNNAQNTVYSISIDSTGLKDNWKLENSLPFPIYAHESMALGDIIFNIGGRNINNQTVAGISHSRIKEDGSLGKWEENVYNLQSSRVFHRSVASDDQIFTLGGLDETGAYVDDWVLIGTSNDFYYGEWQSSINNLPYGLSGAASVVWNGKIYLIGGINESNGINKNIYRANLNSNGTVGVLEQEQNSFPDPRKGSKAVAWENRLYVIGGETENSAPSATYSAPINSNGSLGTWRKENDLPTRTYTRSASFVAPPPSCCQTYTGTGRREFAISVWNGRIYISGGSDGAGGGGKEVLSSKIEMDGSLSDWRYESSLPESVRIHGMSAFNGKLYVVQGYSGKALYSSTINSDGTLSGWSTVNSGLPGDTFPASLLSVNGRLHTFAGYPPKTTNFSNPSIARVNFTAPINEDGSISSWTEEPNQLPSMAPDPSIFHWKGKFFIVGGGGYANPFYIYSSGTPLYSKKGIYLSPIIDLGSPRRLDKFSWSQRAVPNNSNVSVSFSIAEDSSTPMGEFRTVSSGDSLKSAYARFVQYKIEMTAGGSGGSLLRDQTPVLDELSISHVEDPTPPILQSHSVDSNSLTLQIDNPASDTIEVTTSSFLPMSSFSGANTKFVLANLVPNTNYTVLSRKINRDGRVSREVVLLSTYTKSASPTEVIAQELKLDSIKFSWNANNNPFGTTYLSKLYLGTRSELITQKMIKSPAVLFDKLSLGTRYTLYLYALNLDGSLGKEVNMSVKTKELNAPDINVQISTESYSLEWASQPDGLGFRILDQTGKLVTDLPPDATSYFESGFKENEKVSRRIEFYTQTISSEIANVTFYTAVSPPKSIEASLSILEKGATYIRLRVIPPPNPVGKAGVRVRVIPSTLGSAAKNKFSPYPSRPVFISNVQGAKIIDFTDGQWEQTITGLTPNVQYTILTSYINADGIESPPTSTTMALALGFSPLEEEIKLESDRFFVNDGINFLISSNKSGDGAIKIYDVDQNLVRYFSFYYSSGNNMVKWDGKDDSGQPVFSGIYWVVMESAQFGRKSAYVGAIR